MSRALRIRGRVVVGTASEGESVQVIPMISSTAREALADAWLRIARDEHASVAAFARVSTSLVALGAPRELIEACHRAALDELDHTRRAFALASAYAGREFGPAPLHALLAPERETRDPGMHLRKLAIETLEDGCFGEAFAAEVAREAQLSATDPDVKIALAVIARDEAAHAELAWRILYWCCSVGDEELRDALRDKLRELPRTIMPPRSNARIADELRKHGQLTGERRREIFIDQRQDVVARASMILDGFDKRAA